ncbi:hypothetical protein WA026_004612 [Henosepilachna vigintioctopunctata]|uniref:Uncharacterized protein n=1 Tax=Henosepilachna vigintioctopunctata TaxID=420089 RepID=A0AAW1VAH3_9CUCU
MASVVSSEAPQELTDRQRHESDLYTRPGWVDANVALHQLDQNSSGAIEAFNQLAFSRPNVISVELLEALASCVVFFNRWLNPRPTYNLQYKPGSELFGICIAVAGSYSAIMCAFFFHFDLHFVLSHKSDVISLGSFGEFESACLLI